MGHGDQLVICDTNFPADSVSRDTTYGRLLRIDGSTAAEVVRAVLSVMPLDTFIDGAALRMAVIGSPDEVPEVQAEVQVEINAAEADPMTLVPVERFEFYEKARQSYAVIATGERRFYGCFILTKGVVPPPSA